MPQSLASVLIHLIFSTKHRVPLIRADVEPDLHPYLAGICRNLGSPSLDSGGAEDHVHILFSLSRTITISKFVEEVKKGSSIWMKTKGRELREFAWQGGYGAFSIGESGVSDLKRYLATQKEHHSRISFQDEFRLFLTKYKTEYDERYVWD